MAKSSRKKSSKRKKKKQFKYKLFPAQAGKVEQLIIYMHGIGSNASIKKDIVHVIQEKNPAADIISLQAPIRVRIPFLPDNPREGGYSWFHFGEGTLSHLFNRLSIAKKVEKFARKELQKRSLTEENLAYFGSSMGGMVALQAGLSGDKPVAAIVARSSAVLPLTKVKSRIPVLLQMGEKDPLFHGPPPRNFLERSFSRAVGALSLRYGRSIQRLQMQNVPLTHMTYPQQGHTLNLEAWAHGAEFIKKSFDTKPGI